MKRTVPIWVKLDLHALEQEMGFAIGRTRAWWQRLIRR